MTLEHSFKTALTGLTTNKSRSILTILGIVIGITSIILVMSLGRGAQDLILSQIQGLGSKTIVVIPGRQIRGPSDAAEIFSDSLKPRDFEALSRKSNAQHILRMTPLVFGGATGLFEGQTYRLTMYGVSEAMQPIFEIPLKEGAFFTNEDVRGMTDVVVIGSKVKQELFGDGDALGKRIKISNRNFIVIGIMDSKGQTAFFNFDDAALMPYTTASQYILGIKHFNRIIIEADDTQNIDRTVYDITETLRETHGITDPEKDDFYTETQVDLAERLKVITTAFTFFLLAVAAISLLVGGVGIMNIMLVSVTERTREIGLRKAIGAREKDILTQFLLEAVSLTGVGGVIGIALGTFISFGLSLIIQATFAESWTFSFPFSAAAVGLIVSASIGLIFGLYPARQAAKKSPIEALRYE